jgi:sarcosine oxidase subunit beta
LSRIEADVAVVGGGLVGCAAAYYLRKRGYSVVVAERGFIGGQSSGVSFGNLRLQGHEVEELPLALRAQALWEAVERELGESVEFVQHGHVHLALSTEHIGRIERHAEAARPHGLDVEVLGRAETIRRGPFLSGRVLAASWSARDAVVNPRLVGPAFARAATRLGATVLEHTEVIAVEQHSGGFIVRTKAGATITAPILVNAAGAWGGVLARQFGEAVPDFAAGPVEIVTEPVPRFVDPVMHAVDGSILFRQTARGNLVVAGHPRVAVDSAGRDNRVPPDKMATNMARLVSVVPHLAPYHVIRTWTGVEGYLPDMLPAFGPSAKVPGLFHAFAFSGHGLQIGPAIATVLAELIVDGGTQTAIAPFAPGRFKDHPPPDPAAMQEEFQPGVRA